MAEQPSPNGDNGCDGRDERGRFTDGNPGGPGNPYARRTAQIRSAMARAISDEDVGEIVKVLIGKAKQGDVVAAREVLDRVAGKAAGFRDLEQLVPHEESRGVTANDLIQLYDKLDRERAAPGAPRKRATQL